MKKNNKLDILKEMIRIRLVEQYIAKHYPEQKMRCPTHLCLGQEAVPAVFGAFADRNDVFTGTYRSHGHYLAKGGDLLSLFSEILGSSKGCSHGYGGSMHIMDEDVNFYGTSAIVGGGVPIATGAAYAFKYRREAQVAVCFMGDGAIEEGVVYESVNFATLHDLPIVYVCENNRLAVTTPIELRTKNTRVFKRFDDLGLKGISVDDTDIDKMIDVAGRAYELTRKGKGPCFIEVSVHRWATHVGHDYEGPAEFWYQDPHAKDALSCPIAALVRQLINAGKITMKDLRNLRAERYKEIERTFKKASSFPLAADGLFEDKVYASGLLSKLPKKAITKTGKRSFKHKEQPKLVNPF